MRLAELALLYLLVGTGCAVAARRLRRGGTADALLLIPFWPLLGPFLLLQTPAGPGADAFLEALARARGTPLAQLLPDAPTARVLAQRLAGAARRIDEMDRLLALPDFAEAAAEARRQELQQHGDERAAALAAARVANIRRLKALRDRSARDLAEVGELLAQLRVQAEVLRLAGNGDAGTRELVSLLMARVEGLAAALDEESAVPDA